MMPEGEGLRGAAMKERGTKAGKKRSDEGQFRSLVEQIPVVTYVDRLDDPDSGLYVSPQAEEILGISPDEFLHDPTLWYEHVHPDDRLRAVQEWRRARETGEPISTEYRVLAPGGRVVWVSEQARVMCNEAGEPLLVQGVMMDITDRKRAEDELHEAWQREREVSADLRALDRMKNTLLHAVSHDLRGPISAVMGAAVVLAEHEADLRPAEKTQIIAGLGSSANKMSRIVTDLLDMDRIERGIIEPKREPTDLADLVRRVAADLDLPDERPIQIETDPVVLDVDGARVERIVENLVMNAVRHTSETTPVWIRVLADEDGAVIAIEDAGPGVPDDLRGTIFQPFKRGPDETPYGGSGLGLSLVARFAELHGGQAWVQERAGGGASFRVFLKGAGPPIR